MSAHSGVLKHFCPLLQCRGKCCWRKPKLKQRWPEECQQHQTSQRVSQAAAAGQGDTGGCGARETKKEIARRLGNKDRDSERVEQVDGAVNRAYEQVRQNKGQQEWDQSMMISPDDLSNAPLQALGTLPQRYLLTISRYLKPVDRAQQ